MVVVVDGVRVDGVVAIAACVRWLVGWLALLLLLLCVNYFWGGRRPPIFHFIYTSRAPQDPHGQFWLTKVEDSLLSIVVSDHQKFYISWPCLEPAGAIHFGCFGTYGPFLLCHFRGVLSDATFHD